MSKAQSRSASSSDFPVRTRPEMHRRALHSSCFSTRPRSKNNFQHEPQNPTTHLLKIIWLLILETVREESPILGLAQSATSALFSTRLLGNSVDFADSPLWPVVEEYGAALHSRGNTFPLVLLKIVLNPLLGSARTLKELISKILQNLKQVSKSPS